MTTTRRIESNGRSFITAFLIVLVVSVLMISPVGHFPIVQQKAFGDTDQSVIFTNVVVDSNLVPYKQFTVTATVHNSDVDSRHIQMAISVPSEISVSGSVIADLGPVGSTVDKSASWTLVANKTGSFPISLKAYSTIASSGQSDTTEFALNISVGSKSLVITQMNVPGGIIPNSNFAVTVRLKNVGTSSVANVISQLAVPAGLQVLDNATKNIPVINPNEEVPIVWSVKAVDTGSYTLTFSYTSSDTGSNSITGNVNVGANTIAELRPSLIYAGIDSSQPAPMRPGDKDVPLKIVLSNSGAVDLHNITATLKLARPFSWSYSANDEIISRDIQSFSIAAIGVGKSAEASYYVNLDAEAQSGLYIEQLTVSFSDGNKQIETEYDIPLQTSPNVVLTITSSSVNLEPGYVAPIVFNITNNGEEAVHGLSVSTSSSDSTFSSVDSPVWVGDLGVGATKTVTMKIYAAPENITVSPLKLTLSYQAGGRNFQQPQDISVNIGGLSEFAIRTVKVDGGASYPGDTGTRVDFDIVNSGYTVANSVSAKLNLPTGFSPAWGDSDSIYIGNMLPGQVTTASFFINVDNSLNASSYEFPLVVKHSKGENILSTNFIVSSKARFEVIGVSDSNLYPGAANMPLKIVLKNIGSARAESITTKFLGGNNIPGVKSNTVTSVGNVESIGDTVPNQSFTTSFIVNVDPTSPTGDQAPTIEIDWTQSGKSFSQTLPMQLHLSGGPSYLLFYQGIPWTYVIIIAILISGLLSFVVLRRKRMNILPHGASEPSLRPPPDEQTAVNPLDFDRNYKSGGFEGGGE
jgi:hypothetical protein